MLLMPTFRTFWVFNKDVKNAIVARLVVTAWNGMNNSGKSLKDNKYPAFPLELWRELWKKDLDTGFFNTSL